MDRTPIPDLEVELMHQRANVQSLMRRLQALEELVDVLATPWYRKILFFIQGYRVSRVGRWYRKTADLR